MSPEISPLLRSLLEKRGLVEPHAIAEFLSPDYALHTHDPFLMQGMDRAVERLLKAVQSGERIAVYADFDSDGIPGGALMSDFFEKIGHSNFEVYLPHRDLEGHGFHAEALEALAARGAALVITIDVGTGALQTAQRAKELGVDVIITDHHEPGEELPEAVAVLNPKLAPYPFPHLCGAAVAYKLVQAALAEGRRRELPEFTAIPEGWEKWLLDLVAIATIADMVPLSGENRVLAFWGLEVLRKSPRPGVRALCTALRLRQSELTEDEIGFSLSPRINAASRMGEPQSALRLLITKDGAEADLIAAHLEALNASRKGVVAGMVREAKRAVRTRFKPEDRVVVLGNPEWKTSLLGLAANAVVEERGGVACLWGRDGKGRIKGSCRSDGSYSVYDLFSRTRECFEEFGGHERSGGFTLIPEKVHTLQSALSQAAEEASHSAIDRGHAHDALISAREASIALWKEIARLAPFGMSNPKPVFCVRNTSIAEVRRFGKDKNHVEVSLVCKESGVSLRAFDFFRKPEDFSRVPESGGAASVIGTLERDTYRGGIALRLLDVLDAS